MAKDSAPLEAFQWKRQPQAAAMVHQFVQKFLDHCDAASMLAKRMHTETGTRFVDWIDSIELPASAATAAQLLDAGFLPTDVTDEHARSIYRHPGGIFPRIILGTSGAMAAAIKVDSVADFLAVNQVEREIESDPFAPLRRATIAVQGDYRLDIIERRGGDDGLSPVPHSAETWRRAERHLERFRFRRRLFESEAEAFAHVGSLIDSAIADVGKDQACALFFAAEREFWQSRNRAAQVQKARQDRLGLGWANHDHHTYRSSRAHFQKLIALFEKMGVACRERFYAGREAGWGAQVMENPRAGIVVFADVDLAPDEILQDFAHNPLAPRTTLGTVGLWCGLHGESLLQAGMHHLECQFDFASLKQQLETEHGITVMKPFTDYPFLRQAFTEGERWAVSQNRLSHLLNEGLITPEQSQQFAQQGAIGSHLENLERNEGYKGFNQKGVSEIIAATDPRRHVH